MARPKTATAEQPMPRPRGRPPADEPSSRITTWVPTSLHDRLIRLANQNGESVSATVKALLALKIRR
jgi:hypothetical protein